MDSDKILDEIAEDLSARGATMGSMFGSRALKHGTTAFACVKDGVFAAKLGAGTPEHAAALALPGAERFDPAKRHAPFKDWVALPVEQAEHWPLYAEAALDHLDE